MAYMSSFAGAVVDAALARAPTDDQDAALDAANGPGDENPVATMEDVQAIQHEPDTVATAALVDGVLTVDLQGRRRSYHAITLSAAVSSVVLTNVPTTGPVRFFLRVLNSGAYAFPLAAWATATAGDEVFDTGYYIFTDGSATDIEGLSLDGMATLSLRCNAPTATPVLSVSGAVTAANATHGGKRLKYTATGSLTVNASTDLPDQSTIEILAVGGAVTVVASGVTVSSIGGKLIVPQYGSAVLFGLGSDAYLLVGALSAT